MPTAPFNITWWNASDYADPSDDPYVEIDRVITVNGDTLTLANVAGNRTAQEGTVASAKNLTGKTYKIIAGLTAKAINTDLPGMFVCNEIVNGSGTTFTLANNPVSGTVQLIGDRNYLYPSIDYTISGQTITTTASYNTGDILANYIKQ